MAMLHNPDSEYAKEMAKWEAHHSPFGPPGRPYDPNVKFPAMCYRIDSVKGGAPEIVERREAQSETELANLRSRGFGNGAGEAMDAYHARHAALAEAAANRAYTDRNLGDPARREVEAFEASTMDHVAEVPEKRKPGRPKKTN
jgi:hypothetical protein